MTAWLGVDVGWVFPAADSDGNVYLWTRRKRPEDFIAVAGPVTIRRPDGTVRIEPPYSLPDAARALARSDGQRIAALASQIASHAKGTGRGVALEDWSSFSRRKSAWVKVYRAITNAADRRHVPVTQVNRAYTSITCPKCDLKTRDNRATRDWFTCQRCEFAGHADVIAAMNIARRADGTFGVAPGDCDNPVCDEPAWKAQLCLGCYRFRRRSGRLPTGGEVAMRSEDFAAYRAAMRRRVEEARRERESRKLHERMMESYRTHDAWGYPLAEDVSR